ncbi:hypothetical protein ABEG18_21995 [Alsobacter sp. KACC 23698]|uniref:Uncharacterized protein n=1 Tax=Alsobacter sp. KACC 23698 TaxID=3149229 RepID=A0AAU7JDG6_9HYPH
MRGNSGAREHLTRVIPSDDDNEISRIGGELRERLQPVVEESLSPDLQIALSVLELVELNREGQDPLTGNVAKP